jgi:HD-like signal output (HDOD) protein/CheY-like chemotaxis protein
MGPEHRKRILFVDDEPRVLDALEGLLRRYRRKWELVFALGGEAAIAELDRATFDVVVSDMRMPHIDGAAVLTHVRARHAQAVRIILSGYSEVEAELGAVPVAHQFLSKPCDAATLENAIERACSLHALIEDETLRRTMGGIDRLPSRPQVYTALLRTIAAPETTVRDVARLLGEDVAMCAKLLQLVNSSFFGLARRISSVEQAVAYLGFDIIKSLVLSVEVFRTADGLDRLPGFSLDRLQRHALLTGNVASRLVAGTRQAEDAFMAGMLHDIGKLIIAEHFPERLAGLGAAAAADPRPLHQIEESLYGVTHAELGAYLLGLWSLPYPIVEAVAHHHRPRRVAPAGFDLLAAVHVADGLMCELGSDTGGTGRAAPIDEAYLAALGVADRLPAWRELARSQLEAAAGGTPAGGRARG